MNRGAPALRGGRLCLFHVLHPITGVVQDGIRLRDVWAARPKGKLEFGRGVTCALSFAGLAACTALSFRFGQEFAFTGFLYLVIVVFTALYGGFWQATAVSIAAAACLNYFFVPPIFSFVNAPANWVALGAFEFTALVISRLSLRAQMQAKEAIDGRRDVERLYETSRRILLLDSSDDEGGHVSSLIRETFRLKSVQLFDARSAAMYAAGESADAGRQTRDAYFRDTDTFDPVTLTWYCVLRLGTKPIGGVALIGTSMSKAAATALASLCGIALERARALQRESAAQAARQTEQLRTAVLDAMAHQFKTPLTVARTASSGLLAVGGLTELQAELVTVIDQQASKLENLATRLLTAAKLDTTEFHLQREPLLFSRLAGMAVQRLDQVSDRERFQIAFPTANESPIFADRELMLTSIGQLLDNALKYSEPGSPIGLTFEASGAEVLLSIRSKGLVIAARDRERVFERFYRAAGTQHLPAGTGAGVIHREEDRGRAPWKRLGGSGAGLRHVVFRIDAGGSQPDGGLCLHTAATFCSLTTIRICAACSRRRWMRWVSQYRNPRMGSRRFRKCVHARSKRFCSMSTCRGSAASKPVGGSAGLRRASRS